MATLTVTQTTDFRDPPEETGIDSLIFADPNYDSVTVTFAVGQFGPGLISNALAVTGGIAHDHVRVVAPESSQNGVTGIALSAASWTFTGWGAADRVTLVGSGYNDTLTATGEADSLFGRDGDDRLDGRGGVDTLAGGTGNDLYVNPFGDVVIERAGEGNDTIASSRNFSIVALDQIENLILTGGAKLRGEGNAAANAITGNGAANALWGLGGDDTIDAGDGDDAVRAGDGDDSVSGGAGHDKISGEDGDDTLSGAAGNDTLSGGAGSDTLDGGLGTDTLSGGDGDDWYVYDALDTIVESAGGVAGFDTILSSKNVALFDHANVERLILTGTTNAKGDARANIIVGSEFANHLNGGDGNDTLQGGGGDDTLVGGGGADWLEGGAGDDFYDVVLIGAKADAVIEQAGGGDDTLSSSFSISLTDLPNVENAFLKGYDHGKVLSLTGNDLNNHLVGHGGADAIEGGAGNDTLRGNSGNDTLIGGGGDDLMVDSPGNGDSSGSDVFYFSGLTDQGHDTIAGFEFEVDRFWLDTGGFTSKSEAGGRTTLVHSTGSITILGVPGHSLAEWNALVLPQGEAANAPRSASPSAEFTAQVTGDFLFQ